MSLSKPHSKPLSYQTRKCVLGYLEANSRCHLAYICPSLRSLHLLLPLKIEYLKMSMSSFPQMPNRGPPRAMPVVPINPNNLGMQVFGAMPNFPNGFQGDAQADNADDMPNAHIVPVHNFHAGANYYFPDMGKRYRVNNCEHIFELKEEITESGVMFEQPKITKYVVYSAKVDGLKQEMREFPPKITTSVAMKHHIESFLHRKDVIRVDHFDVELNWGNAQIAQGILKLRVRDLTFSNTWQPQHETVFGALDPSSFPLRKLTVTVDSANDPVFRHEHLKSAEYLNIKCGRQQAHVDLWAPTLMRLPMKTVVVSHWNIPKLHLAQLAQNWIQTSRDVGTKFTFPVDNDFVDLNDLKYEILKLMQVQGAGRLLGQTQCYNYPMLDNKELNIYIIEGPDYDQANMRFYMHRNQHRVHGRRRAEFMRFNENGEQVEEQRNVNANFVREKYTLVMEVMEGGVAL